VGHKTTYPTYVQDKNNQKDTQAIKGSSIPIKFCHNLSDITTSALNNIP